MNAIKFNKECVAVRPVPPPFSTACQCDECLAALCEGSRLGCLEYIARHGSGTQSILGAGWLAGQPPVKALGLPIGTQSPPLSNAEVKPQSMCQYPFHFGGEEQGFMYKKTLLCLNIMPAGSGLNLHLHINQPPCKLQDQHTITY